MLKIEEKETPQYAVKADRSPLLDVARETYRENMRREHPHIQYKTVVHQLRRVCFCFHSDITELCETYSQEHNLPLNVKMFAEGFCLETRLDSSRIKHLPRLFTNVVKSKTGRTVTMLTVDLKLNARLMDSLNEVYLMSDKAIEELRLEVVANVAALYKVSEALALLDMISGFAHVAAAQNYQRPEINGTLALQAARHPILDRAKQSKELVPNDIYLPEGGGFCLVTGPNMSGKSTYLRQVALLMVMAMIGSL
ncbi:MutS protein msh4 [Thecaphora frezii]